MRILGTALLLSLASGCAYAADLPPAAPSAELFSPQPVESRKFIDEVRVGATLFVDERDYVREEGLFVSGEVLFSRFVPEMQNPILNVLLRPRPHVGTTVSTAGKTSQIYAGLTWDIPVGKRFFVTGTFGGTVHNGVTGEQLVQNRPETGCSVLFRESIGLGVNITDRWSIIGAIDHSSNSGLCDPNDGLTHAGIWVGYKF
ncbi:acyloxyacyl hydrolase [Propylenella binzhouense]|uniref:Acyloxyacyl hydrolase n=1 Tax=Propylenella binzhouense TaxID=2555902 RepID=A0A964T5H3_9HYPH|nr:acyloxyacyl hydrolase [Propylenella binzhouense]MYZ48257.1 acyloxyacyl hydrolase [Propylenella binzhouense]